MANANGRLQGTVVPGIQGPAGPQGPQGDPADVTPLEDRVVILEGDTAELQGNVETLQEDIAELQDAVNNLESAVEALDTAASLVQKAILTTPSNGTGVVSWTFPVAYGGGVTPIVTATARSVSGSNDSVVVQVDSVSNTGATFKVTRTQSQNLLSTLLAVVLGGSNLNGISLFVRAEAP